jgi:hypothetical protein
MTDESVPHTFNLTFFSSPAAEKRKGPAFPFHHLFIFQSQRLLNNLSACPSKIFERRMAGISPGTLDDDREMLHNPNSHLFAGTVSAISHDHVWCEKQRLR